MELSIWSSYYIDLSPEEMVCEFAKQGIGFSELSDEHSAMLLERGDPEETGRAFRAYAESQGVNFRQGHLLLRCRICQPDRQEMLRTMARWFALYKAIGIERAVLHCDGSSFPAETADEDMLAANIEALKALTSLLEGSGMTICIENLIEVTASAEELLAVVQAVGGEHIAICLDTGHLNLTDKDQQAFIHKTGKHLKALHIADNEGQTDQHMMPFGRGNVDFAGVVRALREVGYDGLFNLEIPGENRCPLAVRGYKLAYIKEVYGYLMGESDVSV